VIDLDQTSWSHPRKDSLLAREKLANAASLGLLADSAMIAHGRGEAFDYLIGERTTESAKLAIREVASRLKAAENPVISVNGNTVVLAGKQLIRVAAVVGCPIEVNLFYRTPSRVEGLLSLLGEQQDSVRKEQAPEGFGGNWGASVSSVELFGSEEDGRIEGLEGPRSICSAKGIQAADTILVPLEDGDRCQALVALGKEVLVIDLNPLSRTAICANVTIVDEVARAAEALLIELVSNDLGPTDWNNHVALREALETMAAASDRI